MTALPLGQTVVRVGTFLYDGQVECDVRILHGPVRYGTGDYEDPADLTDDLERDTYYLEYGSTTERGVFNASGGAFSSLSEATATAEGAAGIGGSIIWQDARASDA